MTDAEQVIAIPCGQCGSTRGRTIATYDGLYPIRRCSVCGLTYTAARPMSSDTGTDYVDEYITEDEQLDTNFGDRRHEALEQAATAVQRARPVGGTILDIGAAGGRFLSLFPPDRWRRTALEPSRVGAQGLRRDASLDVVEGYYPHPALEGRRFDVITMMDVIMIMPDPAGALAAARHNVEPGGLLAVEIPGYWYRALLQIGPVPLARMRRWTNLNARVHTFFFSDASLRTMLERAGFDVESVEVLAPSVRAGRLGRLQQLVHRASMRVGPIRRGRWSLAAKYVYLARPKAS